MASRPSVVVPPVHATATASASAAATDDTTAAAVIPSAQDGIRFEEQSEYARVFVVDRGPERHMCFGKADAASQSLIYPNDPEAVATEYVRLSFLALAHTPGRQRALMIGLGGGTFTTLLRRHFPEMWIDVAEIDPVVVKAAKRFFGVREDERYRIHLGDGGEFVKRTPHRYDLVLLDAYAGDDIPEHLADAVFFEAIKQKTAEQGIVVLNLAVSRATEAMIERRFRESFAEVQCARTSWGNLVLYGRPTPGMLPSRELRRAAVKLAKATLPSFELIEAASHVHGHCLPAAPPRR